jgi:hypothetical protein
MNPLYSPVPAAGLTSGLRRNLRDDEPESSLDRFPHAVGPTAAISRRSERASIPATLTANSIATLFGSNLASSDGAAGTFISITDAGENQFTETLVYASAGQLNFLIPGGLAVGAGTLTATTAGQSASIALSIVSAALVAVDLRGFIGKIVRWTRTATELLRAPGTEVGEFRRRSKEWPGSAKAL